MPPRPPQLTKLQQRQKRLLNIFTVTILAFLAFVVLCVFTPLGDGLTSQGASMLKAATSGVPTLAPMRPFPPCPSNWTNHLPCYDPKIAILYSRENNEFRERHCPPKSDRRRCLVPPPPGYRRPIPWPESRDRVWFLNVPHTTIADNKRNKNWMARQGDKWFFPGGGSMFPDGADGYLYHLRQIVEFGPAVRTALDIGSGVASFGAALLDYGVLTMSVAPKDSYRAQIQFALERGLPAMIGLLATQRLPFPARSFDLIHCSRCSASFGDENSTHVYEVDRLLRPNGYFILAGQPVAWRGKIAEWKRLRLLGKALCWELVKSVGNVAVWRKLGSGACRVGVEGDGRDVPLCSPALDPDDAWYVKLQQCAVPSAPRSWPTPPWPLRLHTPSPRVQLALPASSKASLSDWLAESSENGKTSASSSSSSSSSASGSDSAGGGGGAGAGGGGGEERVGLNGERRGEREGDGVGGGEEGGEGDDSGNVVGRVELASGGAVKVVVDGILAQGGKDEDAEEDREGGAGGKGGRAGGEREDGEGSDKPQRRLLSAEEEEDGAGGAGGGDTEQFKLLSLERKRWRRRLHHYQKHFLGPLLASGRVRNVLDMNAGIGGLAAALEDEQRKAERERAREREMGRERGRELQQQEGQQQGVGGVLPVWVMNVVPSTGPNTLPAIYDRGLLGTVHDWCEAFSSYPRTYDLIHLQSTAALMPSRERCEVADIIVEMDRLLRPGGTVIVRDQPGPLAVVAQAARAAQWSLAFFPPETKKGPERILVATKPMPPGFEDTDDGAMVGESDGQGGMDGGERVEGGGEGGDVGDGGEGGGGRSGAGEGGPGGGRPFEGRSGMAHAAAAAAAAAIDAKAGRPGNR
ncbi:hypothetical protein CLOP_g8513 [Closterium sp. NIES-67]|nr:hypothetical protein CLOP_g8513 [Closterium sp. NIES-67]